MFNKKAQGEIITTVLIILLVLAAIVIVWQVVNSTVQRGGEQVEAASACIGMNLGIVSASGDASDNKINVSIERRQDSLTLTNLKIIVEKSDGTQLCNMNAGTSNTDLPSLGQKTYAGTAGITCTGTLQTGTHTIKVAPEIGNAQCDVATSSPITIVA